MTYVLIGLLAAVIGASIALVVARRATRELLEEQASKTRRAENERVSKEQEAERERAVQGSILGAMEEGVALFDGDGDAVFRNAALERLLSLRPASLETLLPLAFRDAALASAANRDRQTSEVEAGNPPRRLKARFSPLGEDGGVMMVVEDVTDARRMEAIRTDFAANASHELKTPAASIEATAETLLHVAKERPEEAEAFMVRLHREAVRMSRMVKDLLDLSRLESTPLDKEEVDLSAIVRDEVDRIDERAANEGLKVTSETEVCRLAGSAQDLTLLVRNLLDNAISYTKEGGAIDVSLAVEAGTATLKITDTGTGIPSRELPRIFERFYRVDKDRSRQTGGTGLGLAIVKHVAESHGGEVTATSELGRGTTVTVRIPLMLPPR